MNISQQSLHKIVFAAFVMAAVDGFIDDKEIETINRFTQEQWSLDFEAVDQFMRDIDDKIVLLFESLHDDNIEDRLFEEIIPTLNSDEKTVLIGLAENVMKADGVLDEEELALWVRLKKA